MTVFSREDFRTPFAIEDAWKRIVSSAEKKHSRDRCLLPRDYGIPFGRLISSQAIHLRYMEDGLVDAEIIWLEKFRQYALQHDGNMSILESYADFQKYVKYARPDPTRSEWI